jgi:hypothetical protein
MNNPILRRSYAEKAVGDALLVALLTEGESSSWIQFRQPRS